jgi:hypothetical protein
MIRRLNRIHFPTFRAMVADLGHPSARVLARALGVHARTVERWTAADKAPRAPMLALWWLTSWGQSELSCELHNRATAYAGHIEAVKRENDALRRELARVLSAGDFGCSNAPSWRETAGELIARRRV